MPELPDVQVFKEYLDATSLHHTITAVHLSDAERILAGVSGRTLRRHLDGTSLRASRRHGKHLFAQLAEGGWLRIHFGMTGYLQYFETGVTDVPDYAKLRLEFANGFQLAYVNTRKLGALGLVDDVADYVEEAGLGPDALDVGRERLEGLLEGRRGTIKGTLMNQGIVAGLGNIYTDEILFHAGIHPRNEAGDLASSTIDTLHEAWISVLHKAIEGRVESFPSDFLILHREEGTECPRCQGKIRKGKVSGRTTFYCDHHQS